MSSLFDRFQQTAHKLVEEVVAEEVPQVKVLSDEIAAKLARRHEALMTKTREKQEEGAVATETAATTESAAPTAANQVGEDDGNGSESSNDDGANDDDTGFLVFGGGAGGANRKPGAARNVHAAAMSALTEKKTADALFDETAAELFMAPVGALTAIAAPQQQQQQPGQQQSYDNSKFVHYKGQRGVFAPVTVYVPLWAAHRFLPQHAVLEQRSLAAPSPAERERQTFLRSYCGYSPVDAVALHQEIQDFYEWIRPTEGELLVRRYIEAQVCSIAKRLYPECEPHVYGSMTTGLLLPTSDIDITLTGIDADRYSVEDVLLNLSRHISTQGLCDGVAPQVILKTRVPLVKYRSKLAPIDVDVSVAAFSAASGNKDTPSSGMVNTTYVIERMKMFPESRTLIVLFKYFLMQRDLHEPFRGGVGSFAASLLVISFLQHHAIYTTQCDQRANYGLGRLFVDLLQYYGTLGFQPQRTGISLRVGADAVPSTAAASSSSRGQSQSQQQPLPCFWDRDDVSAVPPERRYPGQMAVEDPTCPDNNATSSVRLFQFIQGALEGAYLNLTARAPALHSMLAPAFLYPRAETALYAPPEELFATRDAAQRRMNMYQPINPTTTRRPTLLSRILHCDVELGKRRVAVAAAFARLSGNGSGNGPTAALTAEQKLFEQVAAQTRATKLFASLAEVKMTARFDLRGKKTATGEKVKDPNAGVTLPRHPFAQQYSTEKHVEVFVQSRGDAEIQRARAAAPASSGVATATASGDSKSSSANKNAGSAPVALSSQRRQRSDTLTPRSDEVVQGSKQRFSQSKRSDDDDDGAWSSWQRNNNE